MTSEESDSMREQEQALLHLRQLHSSLASAKPKANAWVIPLLLGAVSGIVLFLLVSILAYLVNAFVLGNEEPSPIPGLLGIVALVIGWILSTRSFRRRARLKSSVLASRRQAAIEAAADELREKWPQWADQLGGKAAVLDVSRVADVLERVRHASRVSWPLLRKPVPAAEPSGRPLGQRGQKPHKKRIEPSPLNKRARRRLSADR